MALAKPLRRTLAILVFVLFLAVALCAAALIPYFLAAHFASIWFLALSSVFFFTVITWCGAWLSAKVWRALQPARFRFRSTGISAVLFVAALYALILRPHPPRLAETNPYDDTRYWQLPTGSRIAYSEFDPSPGVPVKPDPIVFLHGGPGLRNAPFDRDAYSSFAANGFRVILWDQVGSGLSGLLPHIRDYTIARDVDDLEAIRNQLHVDRMILIGHSWGSTLAASYMAKHPDRVAKVVFHSPGDLWNLSSDTFDFSRTEGGEQGFPPLRLLTAFFLQLRNPDAAENLVPQREAEEMLAPAMAPTTGTLVCKGDFAKLPPFLAQINHLPDNPGFNPYVLQAIALQTVIPQAIRTPPCEAIPRPQSFSSVSATTFPGRDPSTTAKHFRT